MAYKSVLANYLLHTPFDGKSVVPNEISTKMSKEVFFTECFSHPKFEYDMQYKFENLNTDPYDYHLHLSDLQNKVYLQKRDYENFLTWLHNFDNNKVYSLCGHAGTGKTTFINYLKYCSKDVEWIILDVDSATRTIIWYGDEKTVIPKEEFVSAHKKICSSILHTIRDILFLFIDEDGYLDSDAIYKNISTIYQVFAEKYAKIHPAGTRFFKEIKKCLNTRTEKTDIVVKIAHVCKIYFEELQQDKYIDEVIQAYLDVLLLLLCCYHKTQKKFIIAFDNIERFISKHEIYNQDVVDIRKNIISYGRELNKCGNVHKGMFKFLMVVRNNTADMCEERLQSLDELASRIDISDWFDTNDIVRQKSKWYKKIDKENESLKLLEQIIGDSRICLDQTITGLKRQIDPLFNNNTRLIIDFVGEIIELPGNQPVIKKYQKFWNENTGISIFSARSLIRGILFKQLKNSDNLFNHFKTYATDKPTSSGTGIVRKILTILYNNLKANNEASMSLSDVLGEMLCVTDIYSMWSLENTESSRADIAEVLFYMNSYNRRDNDWLQFVDLQYKHSNRNIVIKNDSILCDMLTQELDNFSISILPAGIAYLQFIVASFEFFSIRYSEDKYYRPLFDLIPTIDEMKECSDVESLLCIKTITLVKNKALKCISIMNGDNSLKLYTDTGKPKTHAERITNQHKSYLNLFIQYIQEKYVNNQQLEKAVQKKYWDLIDCIIAIRNMY